jgi:NitT/TauT family transport system ATP-binding protein
MIIKGLRFSYDSMLLFDNFDFESKHRITAFKGPSGCGKTTLLKILSKNLIPQKLEFSQFYESTFLVIQEDGLLPWLNGEENIIRFLDIKKHEIKAHELFQVVEPFFQKKTFEMSYGQRRIIELFRAILAKPNLLLLDEPFNFLDNKNRAIIAKILIELSKDECEIVFSSHNNEDLSGIEANIFFFDGLFPVNELKSVR